MIRFEEFKTVIEIPIFLVMFSVSVQGPVFTNLLLYRTCYVDLGYNQSECILLGTENKDNFTQKLESDVEPLANIISMVSNVPTGIICSFLSLFIGCWSDKFGRKPVIIITTIGQVISTGMVIVFCLLPSISSWYLISVSLPIILSGGFAAALTGYFSYVTDITDENTRGIRMGIFEVVLSIGMLIGMISSSYIFKAIGYVGIFAVAASSNIVACIYTIFILEESLPNKETEKMFKGFFEFEQIRSMVKTAFKKRPNNKRALVLLNVAITSLFIFAIMSEGSCIYLFLRLKFGWSLKQYTFFTCFRDIVSIVGTFLGIYGLHKILRVDEHIIILIGLLSCLNGYLVQGLASTNGHIYFGGVLRMLTGNVSPMLRSFISKITDSDEIGKIFSVLIMCENFLQMLGSPLYTYVYNETLHTHPEIFNYLSVGVLSLTIVLTIISSIIYGKSDSETKFAILTEEPSTTLNEGENEILS